MIAKYSDYIKKIINIDTEIDKLEIINKINKNDKEKLEKSFKNEFLNDLVLELSKYYTLKTDDEIRKITNAYFPDSTMTDYNTTFLTKFKASFLIDNNFAFVLADDYFMSYKKYKIYAHKAYRVNNEFRVYKKQFFEFNFDDNLAYAVREFKKLYDDSIKAGQKKKNFSDDVNKFNL